MTNKFEGKVAVITGGSTGMGNGGVAQIEAPDIHFRNEKGSQAI